MSTRPKTIHRSARRRGYVSIDRRTVEDDRLSWAARGVLAYLLAKPDDWDVSVTDLRRRGDLGKDRIYAAIAELIEHGYLERRQDRAERGRFAPTVYHVHERPRPDSLEAVAPDAVGPQPVRPDPVAPHPVRPTQPNTKPTNDPRIQLLHRTKEAGPKKASQFAEAWVSRLRATADRGDRDHPTPRSPPVSKPSGSRSR